MIKSILIVTLTKLNSWNTNRDNLGNSSNKRNSSIYKKHRLNKIDFNITVENAFIFFLLFQSIELLEELQK